VGKSACQGLARASPDREVLYVDGSSVACVGPVLANAWGKPYPSQRFHIREVSILNGDHKKPGFGEINPTRSVPTAVLKDGRSMWDAASVTKMLLLGTAAYPDDIVSRTRIDIAVDFRHEIRKAGFSTLWLHCMGVAMKDSGYDWLDIKESLGSLLSLFELEILHPGGFSAGGTITAADFQLFAFFKALAKPCCGFQLSLGLKEYMQRLENALGDAALQAANTFLAIQLGEESMTGEIYEMPSSNPVPRPPWPHESLGKLYVNDLSPNCMMALIAAKVVGAPVEVVPLDLMLGDQFKPDFLSVSPLHLLPAMVSQDAGRCWGPSVICKLLTYDTKFNPASRRIDIEFISDFRHYFHELWQEIAYPSLGLKEHSGWNVLKAASRLTKNDGALSVLEKFFLREGQGSKRFLLGGEFTVADILLVPYLVILKHPAISEVDLSQPLQAYVDRCTTICPFIEEAMTKILQLLTYGSGAPFHESEASRMCGSDRYNYRMC